MTWPVLLDYNRDECKRILRKLELEAYASIVSAFRAQGEFTKDKKRILQELCSSLSISVERHRAEIRRAVNDEKLGTVAERMFGPNTSMEWAVEGRRLIPLMPRLVPQTAFTALANNLADLQASKNAAMPIPSATGRILKLETQLDESPDGSLKRKGSMSDSSGVPAKIPAMMPSPTASNVSLMSDIIQLSPLLSPNQAQANVSLSPSISQIASVSTPVISPSLSFSAQNTVVVNQTQSPISSTGLISGTQLPVVSANSNQGSVMPLTINTSSPLTLATPTSGITRGPAKVLTNIGQRQIAPALQTIPQVTSTSQSKQVILVSGSTTNIPPSILQRCLSVPVVKSLSTSNTTASVTTGQKSSNSASQTLSTTSRIAGNISAGISQINNSGNMVVYTTTRGRGSRGTGIRQAVVRPRPSLVVPIQQQAAAASGMHASSALIGLSGLVSSQQAGNLMRTAGRGGRGRSAGRGMKIGPQMMMLNPNSTSTRILPKPTMTSLGLTNISQTSLASSPLVVMGSSNLQASISKAANMSPSSPRIVNVMSVTPAPTRILPPTNTYSASSKNAKMTKVSNIVTLCGSQPTNTTVASLSPSVTGSGMKPNVIVVQKAPAWPQAMQQQFGKQLIAKVPQNIRPQKGVGSMTVGKMLSAAAAGIAGTRRSISSPTVQSVSSANQPIAPHVSESFDATQLDPSNLDPKNTLLADLIQAAGIVLPEGTTATVPVSASTMKVLPSNIASSSLRKIAGLSSATNPGGFFGNITNVSKKMAQMKSPKTVKSNAPPMKKVITQSIPKLPPSITITQQADSDVEEVVIAKKPPTVSVKVTDCPKERENVGFESVVSSVEHKMESEKNQLVVENPMSVIEESHIENNVLEVPTSEIFITSCPTSTIDSNVIVETSCVSSFPQEVFTADITASTAVIEQSSDTSTIHSEMFSTDVISDISTSVANTEICLQSSAVDVPVSSEVVVQDPGSAHMDEATNSISFQAEIPQIHEGQVFEIQAPESVIKLLTAGHLTKEVIELIQSVGIKFDGDTPLTLETTVTTEEPIKSAETTISEEIPKSPKPHTDLLFQTDTDGQLRNIDQAGSSVLEVYDSSETVSLIDNQLQHMESIQVVETDNGSSANHVTLEDQQVLTEEMAPDVDSHFVVGECITIEHGNSDLSVSEEVVGSSEVGEEIATLETTVEETVAMSSHEDMPLNNVEVSQMETNEITIDASGSETMSLLEELMEQHQDNFN